MNNIVLIGFMGCGKTTIGRELSQKLSMRCVDTDEEIIKMQKMSIEDIFSKKGEEYFRTLETLILQKFANEKNLVICTGGGIIEKDHNNIILKQMGCVFWLNANNDTILNNLKKSKDVRPLLKDCDIKTKVETLYTIRKPKYKAVCDYEIVTDKKNVEEVISNILLNCTKI